MALYTGNIKFLYGINQNLFSIFISQSNAVLLLLMAFFQDSMGKPAPER